MGFVVQMLQKYVNWFVVQQYLKNMSFEDESNSKLGFRKIPAFPYFLSPRMGFLYAYMEPTLSGRLL
jgi:hypothetical protein